MPTAQLRMTRVLDQAYATSNLNAVRSPFDGMSVGIIKVLKANGYGLKVVPTYLLQPISVDKTNYQALLVDGRYYTESDLC